MMGFTQLPVGPIQAQVQVLAVLGDCCQIERGENIRGNLLRGTTHAKESHLEAETRT